MVLVITVVRVYTVYSKNAQQIETEEIEKTLGFFDTVLSLVAFQLGVGGSGQGLIEKIFQGVRRSIPGSQILLGLPSRIGPMRLNHFLSDGCRSSFKSEGMTIFAYS